MNIRLFASPTSPMFLLEFLTPPTPPTRLLSMEPCSNDPLYCLLLVQIQQSGFHLPQDDYELKHYFSYGSIA